MHQMYPYIIFFISMGLPFFLFFSPIIICTFLLRCKQTQRSVIYMRIATNAAAADDDDDDDDDGDDDDGISFTKKESKQIN